MGIRIALAGNPNCGKTTLFNALTGSNQFVGNWPGVTVEKKEGKLKVDREVTVTDLPGIYSLSPYTLEEVVARNYLIDEKPDAILNIVDGTNLERNLYLTTQLIELGILYRELPFGERENSRNGLYQIEDNMFRFWHRFVGPTTTLIETGAGAIVIAKRVLPDLPDYMGGRFE